MALDKTIFEIKKMDCPSEEQLIRMKLQSYTAIEALDFDIQKRQLTVYHAGHQAMIKDALDELRLDTSLISTEKSNSTLTSRNTEKEQRLLWTVLLINAVFFLAESISGWIAKSMGLIADGLDMLADAIVYGLSLYAVKSTLQAKKNVARLSGYFQISLALLGFGEVIRRFVQTDNPPDYLMMMIVSAFALAGNALCLYLLQKHKSEEAHMKASMIFTSNDVIINIGVMLAGALVYVSGSNKPDLIVGTIVFVLVSKGALSILSLSK